VALYEPIPTPSPGEAPPDLYSAMSRQAQSTATAAGPSSKDPAVFLGYKNNPAATTPTLGVPYAPGYKQPGSMFVAGSPGSFATSTPGRVADFGTVSSVTAQFYSWDQATKDKFLAQAALAGYDTSNMKDGQLAALWGNYVTQAAQYYGSGVAVTPWDIMAKDRAQREAAQPRSVTQKSTSYDLSTFGDARAIFYTAAQQLLGRDPTKAEATSFQAALNKMERANPTITTTTSNYLGQELQSQNSTTEGGVKEGARQMEAMDMAKAKPEYGAYQAATTYFDALMNTIGGMK